MQTLQSFKKELNKKSKRTKKQIHKLFFLFQYWETNSTMASKTYVAFILFLPARLRMTVGSQEGEGSGIKNVSDARRMGDVCTQANSFQRARKTP